MPLLDDDKRRTVLDDAEQRYPKIKDFLRKIGVEYGIDRGETAVHGREGKKSCD